MKIHSAGLQSGDVITHANGSPLISSQDIYKILEDKSSSILLSVLRKGRSLEVRLQPEIIQ